MDLLARIFVSVVVVAAGSVVLFTLLVLLYYDVPQRMIQKNPWVQKVLLKRERAKQLKRFSKEILHTRYTKPMTAYDEMLKPWGLDDRVAFARIDTDIIMKVVGDPLGIEVVLGLEHGNLEPPPEGYKALMTWEEAQTQIWKEMLERAKKLGLKNGNQRN